MGFLCRLGIHRWGKGVQDDPSEADKQVMVAAMKAMNITSIIWSGGKWTCTCARCGKTRLY